MLKDAIALELGNELLVRDGGFFTALGHNRQILQILQQLFVLGNRQQNSGAFTALVREILNGIAHRPEITAGSCYCRETLAGAHPPSSVNVGGARESDVRLLACSACPFARLAAASPSDGGLAAAGRVSQAGRHPFGLCLRPYPCYPCDPWLSESLLP